MKYFLSCIGNVFVAVALSFCAFCPPSVLGLPADDVVPMVDDEYYPQVHKALAAAKVHFLRYVPR